MGLVQVHPTQCPDKRCQLPFQPILPDISLFLVEWILLNYGFLFVVHQLSDELIKPCK